MRVIFGIGNPGNKYQDNRHNVGFMQIDYFAGKNSLVFYPSKGSYYFCEGKLADNEFLLVKPITYVNNSGIAALELSERYNLNLDDFLVIHDDINLDVSTIKVKVSGSDGGHNGLSSLIYNLASNKFPRLRIGIGKGFKKGDMAEYVLSDFSNNEFEILKKIFNTGNFLIEEFISGGIKRLLDANSKISKVIKIDSSLKENTSIKQGCE